MSQNLTIPQMSFTDFRPRITIIGVGGGGASAVDAMIRADLRDAEFAVVDSDPWELVHMGAAHRIRLDPTVAVDSAACVNSEIGRLAAERAVGSIKRRLDGMHLVFVIAGMGGSTGTGAAPVIARVADELGITTVACLIQPFAFEGAERSRVAEGGLTELQPFVDTLIVIPADRLLDNLAECTNPRDAFKLVDHAIFRGVRGVTDLLLKPGGIGLDFADIRSVLANRGKAAFGYGRASGENRAIRAAEQAISDPLLDGISLARAGGILMTFTGGDDSTLFEVDRPR